MPNRQKAQHTNRQTDTTCEYSAKGGTAMTAAVQIETFAKQTNRQPDKPTNRLS